MCTLHLCTSSNHKKTHTSLKHIKQCLVLTWSTKILKVKTNNLNYIYYLVWQPVKMKKKGGGGRGRVQGCMDWNQQPQQTHNHHHTEVSNIPGLSGSNTQASWSLVDSPRLEASGKVKSRSMISRFPCASCNHIITVSGTRHTHLLLSLASLCKLSHLVGNLDLQTALTSTSPIYDLPPYTPTYANQQPKKQN